MLSKAIQQENPELETRKKQLLREKEELQEQQCNLQNQLLEDLANSQGDILKDTVKKNLNIYIFKNNLLVRIFRNY